MKKYKNVIIVWFAVLLIMPFVGLINFLVDPLSETEFNLFNIEKIGKDSRAIKVEQVKSINEIDNIVIGSSRSMKINPELVSKYLGGTTYNFSVGSAMPEDYLGIVKYLIRINKIPKNIIFGFDFFILNDNIPVSESFINEKELNFLNIPDSGINFFTLDKFLLSIKNILFTFDKDKSKDYFTNLGFEVSKKNEKEIKEKRYNFEDNIKKSTNEYMIRYYSRMNYSSLSQKRVKYLQELFNMLEKFNITYYVFLTPVHAYHYNKIIDSKKLNITLNNYKQFLSKQTAYYDFMIPNLNNSVNQHFYDSVHPTYVYSDHIIKSMFENIKIDNFIKKEKIK